jgi:hypothetical protein
MRRIVRECPGVARKAGVLRSVATGAGRDGVAGPPDRPNSAGNVHNTAERCDGAAAAGGRESMGRYMLTVGAVMADAFVSGLTWIGHVSPAALCLTLFSSSVGVLAAAHKIADGIFEPPDERTA